MARQWRWIEAAPKPARWSINPVDLKLIVPNWKEMPVITDDKGNEVIISDNPIVDRQLKAGIELLVRCHSQRGKRQEQAIVDAINNRDHQFTVNVWKKWTQDERFVAYYKALLAEMTQLVKTQCLEATTNATWLINREISILRKKYEDNDMELLGIKQLTTLSKLVIDLQAGISVVYRDVEAKLDDRHRKVLNTNKPVETGFGNRPASYKEGIEAEQNRDILADQTKRLEEHEDSKTITPEQSDTVPDEHAD